MPRVPTPYQEITDGLDFKAAVRGIEANDLLPPRPEDKVAGQLGKRFTEGLQRRVEMGTYDPYPAYIVAAPKPSVATRPAALLSLDDRVMFSALVAKLGPRIEDHLLGDGVVLWPRGGPTDKCWNEFEQSVLGSDWAYIVRADVVGFYQYVDHERLADAIVTATGRRDVANALLHFLHRVMKARCGLPQGLVPSDALATLYLADLDFRMTQEGFRYSRHGDDVRVVVPRRDEGRRALETMERELRRLGLALNGSKTRIMGRKKYEREVLSLSGALDKAREEFVAAKVKGMKKDDERLLEAMKSAGQEQLGWDLFYHGRISLSDAIEKLRPSLKPTDVEWAERVFADAVRRRPGTANAWTSRLFHQRLAWSLARLAAGRSSAAVARVGGLLGAFPEETETLCSYLLALASKEPESVARQAERAVQRSYRTEWELAWTVRVLVRVPEHVSERTVRVLKKTLAAPHGRWLAAVEIVKLLAARGELDRETLAAVRSMSPAVFRGDLVVAARYMASTTEWAEGYVKAAKSERVQAVLARHAEAGW
ncbi:MAG: RNA-directed DNA polymerase [Acidobacteria bacterium]|nr:RNA-directed DNA polymerase [Acidobacteriota bacterium]